MPPKSNKGSNLPRSTLRPVVHSVSPTNSCADSPGESIDVRSSFPDVAVLRAELVAALREDVIALFRSELKEAVAESFSLFKTELLALKAELSGNLSTIQTKFVALKGAVAETDHSLSVCTNDISALKKETQHLSKELVRLENANEELESRLRRQNIRIVGVPEDNQDLSTSAGISKFLGRAFALDVDPIVDCARRVPIPGPRDGGRPRPIVARLHYYSDCVHILSKAKVMKGTRLRGINVSVFQDYSAKVARARATFNDVRRQLRDISGVRFGLFYPARLRITYGNVQRDFSSPVEAEKYIGLMAK